MSNGWFNESARHSLAKRTGYAGGKMTKAYTNKIKSSSTKTAPKKYYGGRIANIGKYYYSGLSSKSNKRIGMGGHFKTKEEAIAEAKRLQAEGKIVQAEIYRVNTALSDKHVADLDTKKNVRHFEN